MHTFGYKNDLTSRYQALEPTHRHQGHNAYTRLIEEIRSGALQPGSRLRETVLSERLETSRTPIREALRMLEADGLVVHEPRLGAVVRSLDYAEIIELYEMRAVFEGTAARLAARTASELELAELQTLNDEFRDSLADSTRATRVNRQFHYALLNSARNRFLRTSITTLSKTLLILGKSTLMDVERARAAWDEHDEILKCLVARDGPAAEVAMRTHIEGAQKSRMKLLRLADHDLGAKSDLTDEA